MSTPSGPSEHGPQFHSKNVDQERAPRRNRSEISKSPVKDRDIQDLNVKLFAALAALPGALLGLLLGSLLTRNYGFGGWIVPASMLGMGLGVTLTVLAIVKASSGASQGLYNPSGGGTPHKKEYSYPESLAIRGLFEDAISAFELVIVEEKTTDPTPFLRIARIYRDQLECYEDSARWLKRAIAESDMHGGLSALVRKELVELYRVKLDMPEKAAPMLARLAEEMAGTPDGEWAASELRDVKEMMRERDV